MTKKPIDHFQVAHDQWCIGQSQREPQLFEKIEPHRRSWYGVASGEPETRGTMRYSIAAARPLAL